jgi:hypothetical protein
MKQENQNILITGIAQSTIPNFSEIWRTGLSLTKPRLVLLSVLALTPRDQRRVANFYAR